jgi:hypothetical protein
MGEGLTDVDEDVNLAKDLDCLGNSGLALGIDRHVAEGNLSNATLGGNHPLGFCGGIRVAVDDNYAGTMACEEDRRCAAVAKLVFHAAAGPGHDGNFTAEVEGSGKRHGV